MMPYDVVSVTPLAPRRLAVRFADGLSGEVVLQDKNFQRTTLPVDDIVSCHTRSNVALLHELAAAGLRVINAGDSVSPRSLFAAVREGASFGLNLDEEMLFNPNHAMVNDLPVDVLGQLRRPEVIELK